MKRSILSLSLLLALPLTAQMAGPSIAHAAAMKVTLNVASAYKHKMAFAHTMASATVTQVKSGDYRVTVTTEKLPMPSAVHQMDYVVWLTNGNMKVRAGALKVNNGMASLKATVMISKVTDVVVTGEHSAMPAHPMGPTVLSGMVG